jgi:peroxidase
MSNLFKKQTRRNRSGSWRAGMSAAAELAEERVLLSAGAIDGRGNNLENPDWGSAGEDLLRLANAQYADAISSVGGEDRPSARLISNTVSDSGGEDVISDRMLSAMIYAWGQFIDHDITSTASGKTEVMSIPVPTGDPSFDPFGTGTQAIDSMRSGFDPATGTSSSNPREQVNQITAFLDGSMIYGSNDATATALRTLSGGGLKTSEGDMLPLNNAETFPDGTLNMDNENPFVSSDELFAAGDVRANENVELTSLQTLFVREHNYQADRIAAATPNLTDEQIYQQARSIVIAEIQAITFNEWLPSLLGRGAIDQYTGYDSTVNPGISNEFATAAFRFGHSLLGDDVEFLDNNGLETHEAVALSEAFFNPDLIQETGIDSILKYLSADPSSEVDTEVVDSIRNFLFGPPGSGGLDLASLNIQRGRDHGLADYNTTREAIGLSRVTSFSDITSDPELASKLESLYGTVNSIDLWVGGLAEDHVAGSSVGETFQTIIVDQFERLRDGDRFWYQNQFSGKEVASLQRSSLSDIIERNTDLTSIQHNAFIFKAAISGTVNNDRNNDGKVSRSEPAIANAQVQLINTEGGSVVAMTTTNRRGQYSFDIANGLRTGVYQVQVTAKDGTALVTSRDIAITGGDDFERINLAAPTPAPPRPAPPKPTPQRSGGSGSRVTQSVPAASQSMPKSATTTQAAIANASNTGPGTNVPRSANPGTRTQSAAPSSGKASQSSLTTPSNVRGSSVAGLSQLNTLIDTMFASLPHGML